MPGCLKRGDEHVFKSSKFFDILIKGARASSPKTSVLSVMGHVPSVAKSVIVNVAGCSDPVAGNLAG
jgi:hypothetical protein